MQDLISRQVAIDSFWELDVEIRPSAINAIIDMIRTLPSAETPKQTGKSAQNVPNDDLISRKAAIEAVDATWWNARGIRKTIQELPSAQQWIPCSERVPQDGTEVFVYLFDRPSPYIAWLEDTHWYTEDFEVERDDEPVAWMPLPEPYKGEEE